MMRQAWRLLVAVAGMAGFLELSGCSGDTGGTGATPDASTSDATVDSGVDTSVDHAGDVVPDQSTPPDSADVLVEDGNDGGDSGPPQNGGDAAEAGDAGDAADVANPGDAADAADSSEAGPCSGVMCNGQCLAASDCHGCTGASLLCAPRGQCVSACSACSDTDGGGLPIECFACDPNGQNPLGSCQPDDSTAYCLSGRYAGAYVDGGSGYRCSCDDAGTNCPGHTQVCTPLGSAVVCLTCGEISTTSVQGAGCRGGGTCNEAQHKCQ